jgi:hypothetical protein
MFRITIKYRSAIYGTTSHNCWNVSYQWHQPIQLSGRSDCQQIFRKAHFSHHCFCRTESPRLKKKRQALSIKSELFPIILSNSAKNGFNVVSIKSSLLPELFEIKIQSVLDSHYPKSQTTYYHENHIYIISVIQPTC